jgi:ABC-type polysaccharide/polyol phosphate transport system ATPase subunit
MSAHSIIVRDLSKVFRIYDDPADRFKEAFSLRRRQLHTDFTALKNINFEVRKGEFLGIVGRNGAGKSTLLRLLSRELTPTTGTIEIHGRLSLLQLGVGFDLELTGIENIRFASKLLGYNESEIGTLLENTIAFADIGDFINHPVKTYSSGMYSRLSFAVGVNINPDILIADEVLSVGDMRFSQKCLRKMLEFKDNGKTVIFVSHDLQNVNVFCDTALWIKDGEVFMRGDAKQVTTSFQNYMLYDKLPNEYHGPSQASDKQGDVWTASDATRNSTLSKNSDNSIGLLSCHDTATINDLEWVDLSPLPGVGDGRAEIRRMAVLRIDCQRLVGTLAGHEELRVLLDIDIHDIFEHPQFGFVLYNRQGLPAIHTNNDICGHPIEHFTKNQSIVVEFRFKLPSLANGDYIFSVGIQSGTEMAHKIDGAFQFHVAREGIKSTQCGYVIIEQESFRLVSVR